MLESNVFKTFFYVSWSRHYKKICFLDQTFNTKLSNLFPIKHVLYSLQISLNLICVNLKIEELASAAKGCASLEEQINNCKNTDSSQSTQTPEPPPLALHVKEVEKPTPQNLLKVHTLCFSLFVFIHSFVLSFVNSFIYPFM